MQAEKSIRRELQEVRTDMRLIRTEVQELRAEVQGLRTDMLMGFAQVERRMNAAFVPLSLYF